MTATVDTIDVLHVDDEQDSAGVVAAFLEREDDRSSVDTATSARDGGARFEITGVEIDAE